LNTAFHIFFSKGQSREINQKKKIDLELLCIFSKQFKVRGGEILILFSQRKEGKRDPSNVN
jgi:hypothetical protein